MRARRDRFELTRAASRLLYEPGIPAEGQHRTVWCHRSIKNASGNAYVWRRDDGSSARLTGVTTCGNVRTCPICSARVAEKRRELVELGMTRWIQRGGYVYLLTLTFPHERDLELKDSRAMFAKALQRFKNSRAYKRILGTPASPGQYSRLGSIRSLEFTWGDEHGWHPHTHDLVFAKPGLEADDRALDELRGAWIAALMKAGLGDRSRLEWMWRYAMDLRGGQYAAEYVSKFGRDCKWGGSSEITRQHAKIGARSIGDHKGHCTPFQILAWAAGGDAQAAHLFREFASATEGDRMLYWSPGLKRELGIPDDRTDEEIAGDDSPLPAEREVATITADALALITSRGALGELIEFVCHLADPDPPHVQACVDDFLEALKDRPRVGRATIRQRRAHGGGFMELEPELAS